MVYHIMQENNKIKILVIDDDKLTLLILEKTLSNLGLHVEVGKSAVEAIKLLTSKSFDVVISDIKMENLSGFELMIWMKSNKINSKLIMMSSDVTPTLKKDYENYGVLQILSKPFSEEELIENINFALEENFNANISNLSIFDLIKIVVMSNKDRGIVIKSAISEKIGVIYIKKGQIIFAQYDNLLGEKAFYNLMSIQNGIVTEVDFDKSIPQNISLPFDFLIMESARFMDDSNDDSHEKIKVLAVDDDPITLKIIEEFLSKKSCLVTTETSSPNTLNLLKENKYNFLISDINMPEFNGFQLLDAIRESGIHISVIFITAHGSDEYETLSTNKGALKYLEKPINLNELYKLLTGGIKGTINEVTLLDYVQLIINSQVSSLITVKSPISNKNGKIYIKNGKIIHAECNDLLGEDAFYEMALINKGSFSQEKWKEPENISIDKSPMKLLINFSNILDKSNKEKENALNLHLKEINKKVEQALIKASMELEQNKNIAKISFTSKQNNSLEENNQNFVKSDTLNSIKDKKNIDVVKLDINKIVSKYKNSENAKDNLNEKVNEIKNDSTITKTSLDIKIEKLHILIDNKKLEKEKKQKEQEKNNVIDISSNEENKKNLDNNTINDSSILKFLMGKIKENDQK
jgi:CheY-like chemotaxis protein